MVCLAKAICGGLPGGAIGMSDELAALVESGAVRQQGTFNGNPLVMAAAEATLLEVLTPDAYAHLHGAQRAPDGRAASGSSPSTACPPTRSAWAPRAA